MEQYFEKYRNNTIGHHHKMQTPYGVKSIIYADWIASGRLYQPIEDKMQNVFGPWVANTHTETSETGTMMTKSYHWAQKIIKKHVNANDDDILITSGNGMTSVINKFQRILGLKNCGVLSRNSCIQKEEDHPIVFITHMEHHSNHTSWLETNADVVVLEPAKDLTVDPNELEKQFKGQLKNLRQGPSGSKIRAGLHKAGESL